MKQKIKREKEEVEEVAYAKREGKLIAQNRKARHDYSIIDTVEAGLVFTRNRNQIYSKWSYQFKRWFCTNSKRRSLLYNVHISPYEQGNILIMTHYVPENYYYTKTN